MIAIIIVVMIYLIPSIIATSNKKRNAGAIVVLNVLAGWMFIPWIIALVWACSKDSVAVIEHDRRLYKSNTRKHKINC